MKIRIGHTPDADDAFMFYGINQGFTLPEGLEVEHLLEPMQMLNQRALEGQLEMTAFSFATYARVAQHYRPLSSGFSLGHATGPMIVVRPETDIEQLRRSPLAGPGPLTSAAWLARLWNPDQVLEPVPFDQTLRVVEEGRYLGALVIHEGQMQIQERGLRLLVDLGRWWFEQTGGLPTPLGLNGVRRDLPTEIQQALARALADSIGLALAQEEAALDQALPLARGLDRERCREFVRRYVNASTLDPGPSGFQAVQEFYARGLQAGLIESLPALDWVSQGISSA